MKNNLLTKQEKNQIYKLALELYEGYISEYYYPGMCRAIHNAIKLLKLNDKLGNSGGYKYILDALPEFAKLQSPDSMMYWWEATNTEIRIKNFKMLINQTN